MIDLKQIGAEGGHYNNDPPCSEHPDAPHGFDRNRSHSLGRYVCDCEGWVSDDIAPEEEDK